ncbi:DNA polymerase III subunit delta [Thalassiella azotivora]
MATARATTLSWRDAAPAPLVLVTGTEGLLADRAVDRVRAAAAAAHPDVETVALDASTYESGQLGVHTSPSLFGEPRLVLATAVEACTDAFVADVVAYLSDLQDDVVLVLRHGGGQRGKKLLDAVKGCAQGVVVDCPPVKKDAEKSDFVSQEFRAARRKVSPGAVRALLDAVGSDLRELASSCAQLLADTTGEVTEDDVQRYYGGRVEATGFKVADAVAAGRAGEALALLRQAVDTGVDPVPLVAVIALKLRTMARVAATRGRGADVARELGLAPWQVDRARRDLRGWTPEGLAAGLIALAEADEAVKGGGRDPVYAVERAVLTITSARGD